MKIIVKRTLAGLILFLILVVFFAGWYVINMAEIGAGYMAKMMCSHVFISGMEPDRVAREDVYDPILESFSYEVNDQDKSVTVLAPFGLVRQKAIYRPCLGAVLDLDGRPEPAVNTDVICSNVPESDYAAKPWPEGDVVEVNAGPAGIDIGSLNSIVDAAFEEPFQDRLLRTRAVVIVYKGRIIAEKYAAPFTASTPLIGWSMTKSITNALVGIRIQQGQLRLDQTFGLKAWQDDDDPRRQITLEQMLRMSSGLEFDESYANPLSDVVVMLFNSFSASAYAAEKPLAYTPGLKWYYSSGTTNIISEIVRQSFGSDYQSYLEFPFKSLFRKIGMFSAVLETDPSGTFVGSSLAYATARDWARFGLLYLRDGMWNGERLLPRGWVTFSSQRTEISRNGRYAAHFWLPARDDPSPELKTMYYASGHDGQFVNIVPEYDLVVVRLGLSKQGGWDQQKFVSDIINTLP